MNERLQSMYATAQDLVDFDDVEAHLARITERAAAAVRPPKYLQAAHAGYDARMHVHHRGFGDEDPDAAAQALLDDDAPAEGESRLVVDVASRTRHYGRLMAASP